MAVLPVGSVATLGVTVTQPTPVLSVIVGVIEILPVQEPAVPSVKFCVGGFVPVSAEKANCGVEGACKVQAGCAFSVTGMACGVPIGSFVTLSVAVMVIVPLNTPGLRPVSVTAMLVVAFVATVTVPVAGVAASQVPPVGVVLTVAVQLRGLAHAPLAASVTV